MEALRSKQEKKESNRKKRKAQQEAKRLQAKCAKLRRPVLQEEGEGPMDEGCMDSDTAPTHRWQVRGTQRNKGITRQFEAHVRCALATGATARQVQDMQLVDSNFFLPPEDAAEFCATLPQIRWFQSQREGLGLESYLYGFMRIAAAKRILQWGFDETTLDGVSCLNQWALLEFDMGEGGGDGRGKGHTVVTLECAGVVPGGTADEIVAHIQKAWERGQAAVEALRAALQPEDRDTFCPLVEGGVNLHKLYGVMHDTCHCANLVAARIVELRDKEKRAFLSEEVKSISTS